MHLEQKHNLFQPLKHRSRQIGLRDACQTLKKQKTSLPLG
jgi:hypothetical protein